MPIETTVLLFGAVLSVVFIAVAVFFVLLLIKLTSLSKEAEGTLKIVNGKLPDTLDNIDHLVDHAEESLEELDATLKAVQEPLDRLSSITNLGKGVLSQAAGMTGMGGAGRIIGSQIGMRIISGLSQNLGKVAIGAITGGLVTLLRKLFTRKGHKNTEA